MKTVVVISDTHRNVAPLSQISQVLSECDIIVHLGDMASDARELMRMYPEKTYVLAGNNDFFGGADEVVIDVEGRRIFACHGHRYGVKSGTERLVAAAKTKLCDIALYGHTHEAETREENDVLLINPGCMTRYSYKKSYCYLVVEKTKAVATLVEIPERG